jgi:hypothetical protein
MFGTGFAVLNPLWRPAYVEAARVYVLVGDFNQEGALSGNCDLPQNNRGGLFFVAKDTSLATEMRRLMNVR